jgi:hypothetical protein
MEDGMMVRLSDEQRRVLKMLVRRPRSAKDMRTGVRTLVALSERKLIYVPCTLDNIALPARAIAEITDKGRELLCGIINRASP